MFDETLKTIIANTDQGAAALIMGLDGICVARAAGSDAAIDIDVIAAEYTTLLRKNLRGSGDGSLGPLREIVIAAERHSFLIKPLTEEYFLVLALAGTAALGRARFELRKAQLALEEEFSI
jgi:predicted regulator of Ras-like GTPase activity (Roadblock/LC7/MglB family)